MVRAAFFDEKGVKKGAWSKEEDEKLRDYITRYGHWNWRELPKFAGLSRCGKSCRLRWMNYLRPDLKHGNFTKQEDELIFQLYQQLGTKWSTIASKMPGRTDNEIKNYWHAHLKKRVGWTAAKNDITSPSSTSSSSQPQYHSDSTRTSEIEEILEADLMGTPSSSSPAINMMVFSPPILESSPLSPAAGSSWKDEYYKEDGGGLFGRPAGTSLHKEEQQVVVKSDNYYSNNSGGGGGGGDFWSEPFLVDDDNSDVHRPPYDFSWVMSEDVCFQQQFDDDVESLMYRVMQELPDTTTTTTN